MKAGLDFRIDELDNVYAKQAEVNKRLTTLTPIASYNTLVKRVDKCAVQEKTVNLVGSLERKVS